MIQLAIKTDLDLISDAQLEEAGESWIPDAQETAKEAIITKTDKGLNADNAPMSPYSEGWKEKRIQAGKQVAFKDLKFTGDMKAGFVTDDNILTLEESVMARAAGNDEREDFFAVGQDTYDEIEREAVDKFMEELGL